MLRRLLEKIKLVWKLAKSERATPREIGWAVAIGAFAGCSPAVGLHGPLAMALATLARKNRLFAWLGSRVSNPTILPFIVLAEVQIARWLRTGAFVEITRESILTQAPHLLLDWCLGTVPVGAALAIVMGLASYVVARRRDARARKSREAATTTPAPAADPPPSSGSRA